MFQSYAQNFEDVTLWRALKSVKDGVYIDVGAADPVQHSVTCAFYLHGWSGINIEPQQDYFSSLAQDRPRDVNLRCVVGEQGGIAPFFEVQNETITGLSTLSAAQAEVYRAEGWRVNETTIEVISLAEICAKYIKGDIHFLKIDVEGAERLVLLGADFKKYRPWIVLLEATIPNSPISNHDLWEDVILAAGYRFAWFDGLNRFYVAKERYKHLAPLIALPPNVFDRFLPANSGTRPISTHGTGQVPFEPRPLAFLHIHQTMGSSLATLLAKLYGTGCCPVYDADQLQISPDDLARYRMIFIHGYNADFANLPATYVRAIFLRNPFERFIERLEHIRLHRPSTTLGSQLHQNGIAGVLKNPDLEKALMELGNEVTIRLSLDRLSDRRFDLPFDNMMATAMHNISGYDVIGLLEYPASSTQKMLKTLGFATDTDLTDWIFDKKSNISDYNNIEEIASLSKRFYQYDDNIYKYSILRANKTFEKTYIDLSTKSQILCHNSHKFVCQTPPELPFLLYGPNMTLWPGRYSVTFEVLAANVFNSENYVEFQVTRNQGQAILTTYSMTPAIFQGQNQPIRLEFNLDRPYADIEFRAVAIGTPVVAIKQDVCFEILS